MIENNTKIVLCCILKKMLVFWIIIFVASLIVLVKGADWMIDSAEKIGLGLGLSPFMTGMLIVGVGTSFPELISAIVATFRGVTEVVVANAVGSNITNILLVVGLSAIMGKKLVVIKSFVKFDLPLLVIGTILLFGSLIDSKITLGESILLVGSYIVYLIYTFLHKKEGKEEFDVLPSRRERRRKNIKFDKSNLGKIGVKEIIMLLGSIVCLVFGAEYLIEALINLSKILNLSTGVIAMTMVALGTSLPELVVSIKAAFRKKSDVALGNIFGSNVFNTLMVIGIPGLFKTLTVDSQTLSIGAPTMILATLIFVISGISKKIHAWEGILYLLIYVLFLAKLFGWF